MKRMFFLLLVVFFLVSYTEATYAQTPRDAYIAGQAHHQSTMMQQRMKQQMEQQRALQEEMMQEQLDLQGQTPEMPIYGPGPVEGISNIKPH